MANELSELVVLNGLDSGPPHTLRPWWKASDFNLGTWEMFKTSASRLPAWKENRPWDWIVLFSLREENARPAFPTVTMVSPFNKR